MDKSEESSTFVEGINISSRSTDELGKQLTNPNWNAKHLMDVEAPYKAGASKITAKDLNFEDALKYDMNLMYKLQVQKFRKNPELIDKINERGGLQFIENSSHIVGVKNSRWEGKGLESNFIKVLAKSYETVAKELNKFQNKTKTLDSKKSQPVLVKETLKDIIKKSDYITQTHGDLFIKKHEYANGIKFINKMKLDYPNQIKVERVNSKLGVSNNNIFKIVINEKLNPKVEDKINNIELIPERIKTEGKQLDLFGSEGIETKINELENNGEIKKDCK